MTVLWFIVGGMLLSVWVLSVVDIFRRNYSTGTTVGYLILVVILPFVGSLIYWSVRKPTREETELEYRAEAELRRSAGARSFDSEF
jgi:hypothetical protein